MPSTVRLGDYRISVIQGKARELTLTALSISKVNDSIYRANLPEIAELLFGKLSPRRYELLLATQISGSGEDSITVTMRYLPEVRRRITRTLGLYIPVLAVEVVRALRRAT